MSTYSDRACAACLHCAAELPMWRGRHYTGNALHTQEVMDCLAPPMDDVIEQQAELLTKVRAVTEKSRHDFMCAALGSHYDPDDHSDYPRLINSNHPCSCWKSHILALLNEGK